LLLSSFLLLALFTTSIFIALFTSFTFIVSAGALFPTRGLFIREAFAGRRNVSPAGISPGLTSRLSCVGAFLGWTGGTGSFRDSIATGRLDALEDRAAGILLGILDVADVVGHGVVTISEKLESEFGSKKESIR
jgi:hypothetical protein